MVLEAENPHVGRTQEDKIHRVRVFEFCPELMTRCATLNTTQPTELPFTAFCPGLPRREAHFLSCWVGWSLPRASRPATWAVAGPKVERPPGNLARWN